VASGHLRSQKDDRKAVNEAHVAIRAPGALPLLGHALSLFRRPLGFLATLANHGDLVRIRVGPLDAVVICDPTLTDQVLRNDRTFDKGGPIYNRMEELTGNNVATCPHAQHRRQRRLVQPALRSSRLPDYQPRMIEQIDKVIGNWRDDQIIDAPATMYRIAARVLFATMFGSKVSDETLDELVDDITVVMGAVTRRAAMPTLVNAIPTPANRRYNRAHSRLQRHVDSILSEDHAGRGDNDTLLSMLLAARDDPASAAGGGQPLTKDEVKDNLRIFLLGGIDTTANVLCWALHLLTEHPRIQRRLHSEIGAVLGENPDFNVHASSPAPAMVDNVITETLRLYPPGWLLTRTATTDTVLGGHAIQAGTTVIYSPYIIHRRADLYPDPERFDPDRWDQADRDRVRPGTFVAFGGGPRRCVGESLARLEAALVLSTIISRWRVCTVPGPPVAPSAGLVLGPKQLQIRITPWTNPELD